ncbi:hypothetical protein [Arthrobacter sp. Br18]|uniref:hypothetical protein n=1 Tax=Arthrobacter sp. Br18 TaxID=1312954 RepID=UPI00047D12F6|nr:hypothetical protein [Arthrobacter sp. Br18]
MDPNSSAESQLVPIVLSEVGPLEADPVVQVLPTPVTVPDPGVPASAVVAFPTEQDSSSFERNLAALRRNNSLPGETVTGVSEPMPAFGSRCVPVGIDGDGD